MVWKSTFTKHTGYTYEQIQTARELMTEMKANGTIGEPPYPDEQIGDYNSANVQYIRYWNSEAEANLWHTESKAATKISDSDCTWVLVEV